MANIKNIFVEGFGCGKVCAVAKCNGVSEDLLGVREPCWAQVRPVDADFRVRCLRAVLLCGACGTCAPRLCPGVASVTCAVARAPTKCCLLAGTIGAPSLINECLALRLHYMFVRVVCLERALRALRCLESRRGGACSAHALEAKVEGGAEGPEGKEAPLLCLSKARRSRATARAVIWVRDVKLLP